MRRIRLRLRLKRPEFPATGSKSGEPDSAELPRRTFPPVPDGQAVPGTKSSPGELPARQSPSPRVSPAITRPSAPQVEEIETVSDTRAAASVHYQPVLPSLGAPLDPVPSVEPVPPAADGESTEPAACKCPACGAALASRPHTKSACGGCGVTLHVRNGQRLFPGGLVPGSEVDAVDLMERLEPLGITWEKCSERLEKDAAGLPKAGALAVLLRDLCEERLPELLPGTQVRLLHEMARERQYRSEDPRPLLRRAQVILLQKMRDGGVERVRVACHGFDACPACREQAGRSVTIAEALEQQLLPLADCRQAGGFCRCRYTEADGAPGPTLDPQAR